MKTDKELQTLPDPVADVLNGINDTSSQDSENNPCYNGTKLSSNSVIELWNPTLKAINLAMSRQFIINNGFWTRYTSYLGLWKELFFEYLQ